MSPIIESFCHTMGDDWTREQVAYEINRLNRILHNQSISSIERDIATAQLDDYLETIANGGF